MSFAQSQGVTVITVNWNGKRDTIACLESLQHCIYVTCPINIVVVDNASADDSVSTLQRHLTSRGWRITLNIRVADSDPRVKSITRFDDADSENARIASILIVEARDNFGFAAGNNIGRQIADATWVSEFYWLLNNDTQVAPDALKLMLEKMGRELDVGVCGCTILYAEHSQCVQSYGGAWYSLKTGRGWSVGMDQIYDPALSDTDIESKLNYISGAAMFIRANVWNQVGPMSEDYFLYNEEIDLCMRLPQGNRLGVSVKSLVYHRVGSSIGTDKGKKTGSCLSAFFQTRSKLMFAAKHTPKYWLFVWVTLLARAIKLIVNPATSSNALVILSVLFGKRRAEPVWFADRSNQNARKS